VFYLDECHLKKKLHNSFNLYQSTKCVHLQSSLTSIFTLIVIFNLHTETDIIVFYEDGLPLKKKKFLSFPPDYTECVHLQISLEFFIIFHLILDIWLWASTTRITDSRDNLDFTGCSKAAAYLTPIKPLLKAIMAITKHISRKTFFIMLLYNQVYRIPVCVKSQLEHQRVRKEFDEISATF